MPSLIMTTESARAILDGRKTQTRRLQTKRRPFAVGDVVYVKEAYKVYSTPGCSFGDAMMGRKMTVEYRTGETVELTGFAGRMGNAMVDCSVDIDIPMEQWGTWRNPLFMPLRLARLWLEIVDVRVQRLHEISEADAIAEGCTARTYRDGRGHEPATVEYRRVWDSINRRRAPWSSNPWVTAYTFRRTEAPDA